jgi:hypothetical protein
MNAAVGRAAVLETAAASIVQTMAGEAAAVPAAVTARRLALGKAEVAVTTSQAAISKRPAAARASPSIR